MHVLFEGLDLAGKSTLCRRFQEKAEGHWAIRSNSIIEDNEIFRVANQLRKEGSFSPETLGNLFYAALLGDLEKFSYPDANVIQDSTIVLRSLAYHTVSKTPRLPELFEELLERHPRFDYAFVCSAPREVRLQRLAIRRKQNLGPEDFLVRDEPDTFFAMESILIDHARRAFNAEIIDTGNLENAEGLDRVFDVIGCGRKA